MIEGTQKLHALRKSRAEGRADVLLRARQELAHVLHDMRGMALIRHILVATDFSDTSGDALEMAVMLAKQLGARLTLLHSTWMPPYYYSAYAEGLAWPIEEMDTAAARELNKVLAKVRGRIPNVEGHVVPGEPWERILEAIDTYKPDLVVLGTHGRRGVSRAFIGSVAERIVRLSPVPVLTVRPTGTGTGTGVAS